MTAAAVASSHREFKRTYLSRAGVCAELLEDILTPREWVTSDYILEEVTRKLREKFRFPAEAILRMRESIAAAAHYIEPTTVSPEPCRDPNDLSVLGTALAGADHRR